MSWRFFVPDGEGYTYNISFRGEFTVVQCFLCRELMKGPFWGGEWWEWDELYIRKQHRCEHCGYRNRVSKGVQKTVQNAEELE